ncbi:hypothetical protein GSY71_00390 [Pusillimonas sp. TS35]|uniref:C40 family peptidase n=1 Tax=Paracandidimonas lactea TaxID=2895524 RepID=UPI001368D386|nr:C40 family peptidase [Paracandidimonas lactea]MYN11616.1 hypothetical protein [Pusillimonas sp. TS35]
MTLTRPRLYLGIALLALLAACAGPTKHTRHPARHIAVNPAERDNVALTAMSLVDTPYRYGGNNPESGFDCSGLVNYVFNTAASTQLPRQSSDIAGISRPVSRSALKAGDFVFFNTLGRPNSHVGIYVGNGKFVNAPSSGGRVRLDSLDSPYFSRRFDSARTVFTQ